MITHTQKQEIIYDLLAKNLPLDLLLEIKDHMEEQINYKIDFENKSFEIAYCEVKKSWEKDLKMVYTLSFPRKKITVFHKKIVNKTENGFLKKTLTYFLPFFLIGSIMSYYSKVLGSQFYFTVYVIISIITVTTIVLFYKHYNSTTFREERKISIYQRGTLVYFISGLYVIVFNLLNFENRFEKFYNALSSIISGNYTISNFLAILYTHIFIFGWIYGLHYFLKYRNTVIHLKNRINLKL